MGPRSLRRRLPSLALAGCLALLPAAARALPAGSGPDGPATVREQVGGWLDWLGQTFLSLERVTAELIARLAALLRRKG